MKISTVLLAAFLITFFGLVSLNAKVYEWTDENGVKHYGDQPPENAKNVKTAFENMSMMRMRI